MPRPRAKRPDDPAVLTADRMAVIAPPAGPTPRIRWTPRKIETLARPDNTFAVCAPRASRMMRVSGEEAELLSLDVLPDRQGQRNRSGILQEALRRAA
jgi:hypothetical protein